MLHSQENVVHMASKCLVIMINGQGNYVNEDTGIFNLDGLPTP